MPRGRVAQVGDKTINKNGYEFTRTENDGWVGSHVLLMEEHLGRKLYPHEFITFKNGHAPPVTLDMIELRRRGDRKTRKARIAEIEHRIEELQAELQILRQEDTRAPDEYNSTGALVSQEG